MLFSCYQFVIQLKSDTNKESLSTREVLKSIDFLDTTPLNKQGKDHVLTDHKWARVSKNTCCIHEIQKEHTSWQIRQWVIGEIWILMLGVPAASRNSLPLNAYATFTLQQSKYLTFLITDPWSESYTRCSELVTSPVTSWFNLKTLRYRTSVYFIYISRWLTMFSHLQYQSTWSFSHEAPLPVWQDDSHFMDQHINPHISTPRRTKQSVIKINEWFTVTTQTFHSQSSDILNS